MAFQPVVDTAEIDVIYTEGGVTVQNTFYAELPGGYVVGDLVALAAAVDLQVAASWLPIQVIEAFYARTEVRGLALQNDLLVTTSVSAGSGAVLFGALPNNVTLAIKKESGLTGRSARGRSYWIGPSSIDLETTDENQFKVAYAASVVTAIDAIRVAIATVGLWQPVLVSRFSEGVPRVTGLTFPWVASSSVDIIVDTQRGRLPG